jgi:hypothetical protein
MSDMVHEGNARILAATHTVNPAACPVRDGHPRMHSECAICGQQPPARVEAAQAVKAWGLGSEAWAERILHPADDDDYYDDHLPAWCFVCKAAHSYNDGHSYTPPDPEDESES